jgi:hypothetical protein
MSDGAWAVVGVLIGALMGLIPRLFDQRSSTTREKQEQEARLRAMLAGVLMKCVHSTNDFLNQWAATLRLDPAGGVVGADDLRKAMQLAFEMKTAWMDTLVSFGDPAEGTEPSDRRRRVIELMLSEVDTTYDRYQDGDVTTEQVTAQLQEISRISRLRLNELIGLGPDP